MKPLLPVLLAVVLAAGPAEAATRTFVIEGRGWGHGVGMSQWGAEGLARHGTGYRSILFHYYPGTRLARVANAPIRVLLDEGRTRVVVSSRAPLRVVVGRKGRTLLAGRYAVPGPRLRPPLQFEPGAKPLLLDGAAYRGSLRIAGGAGSLSVVNVLPLERYLRGVVPWEMPFYWQPAALEAQAVAARSYALSQRKPAQAFDVYDDTRDQVYGGIRAETDWTNRAVGATAGRVLTWRGRVALTYYFSTSGGRTAAVSETLPWAPQLPYLVSVPDPYDAISPHHRWGPVRVGARTLASKLGVPAASQLALFRSTSGRVAWVDVLWPGGRKRVSGRDFQAVFNLRSTWFSVGGAAVTGPPRPAWNGEWPAGRSGWTVVLDSVPAAAGLTAAKAVASRARRAGAPQVGVLDSAGFSSLRAGYWVVFSGVYESPERAQTAARSLAGRYLQAYVRRVVP